jgi:hypothetical protein
MAGSIWERFTHDPRHDEHARLRASDSDRDIVNDVLGTAYSEGRLTPEELDERSDQVVWARTLGELPPIMGDLVIRSATTPVVRDKRAEAERRYRQQRQQALFSFLTPTLICWVIWISLVASSRGTSFPWPVFVTIGTGMRYLQLVTSREDTTHSIERDLEKKERNRLESQQRKELGGSKPSADERED